MSRNNSVSSKRSTFVGAAKCRACLYIGLICLTHASIAESPYGPGIGDAEPYEPSPPVYQATEYQGRGFLVEVRELLPDDIGLLACDEKGCYRISVKGSEDKIEFAQHLSGHLYRPQVVFVDNASAAYIVTYELSEPATAGRRVLHGKVSYVTSKMFVSLSTPIGEIDERGQDSDGRYAPSLLGVASHTNSLRVYRYASETASWPDRGFSVQYSFIGHFGFQDGHLQIVRVGEGE